MSDRQNRGKENNLPSINHNDLMSVLECPICKDILSLPVFCCINGHSLCGECIKNMSICGLCRAGITITRNRTLEKILEKTKVSCSNAGNAADASDGCGVTLMASQLKAHETVCDFRPIKCLIKSPSRRCHNHPIQFSNYYRHIRDVHKLHNMEEDAELVYDNNNGMAVDSRFPIHYFDDDINCTGSWPTVYYRYDGRIFIVKTILTNGVFSTWGSLLGSRAEAANYKINMTLLHHIQNTSDLHIDGATGSAQHAAQQRPNLADCRCACQYEGEIIKKKEFPACRVFTAHVQKYTDLEDGESPLRLTLDDLPSAKIRINLSRKRKRTEEDDDDDYKPPIDLMYSWSIIFNTYKVRPTTNRDNEVSLPIASANDNNNNGNGVADSSDVILIPTDNESNDKEERLDATIIVDDDEDDTEEEDFVEIDPEDEL